jgi:SAM-dependent methyltransferase
VKEKALEYLACPRCLKPLQLSATSHKADEVWEGKLICTGSACEGEYRVSCGVPRFNVELGEQQNTAAHFGCQWTKQLEGKFEKNTVYGVSQQEWVEYLLRSLGISLADLQGKRILDAGCGSGKLASALASQDCEIVCLDIHNGIDQVYAEVGSLPNVHVVQGDILGPPPGLGRFDIVWSSGVIHHTPNPKVAFETLAYRVATNGLFYVWVFRHERKNPYRIIRDTIKIGHRLPPGVLCPLSYIFAIPLYAVFTSWYLFAGVRSSAGKFMGFDQVKKRKRNLREIALTMFDNFNPKYHFRLEERVVAGWFGSRRFADLLSTDQVDVGISARRNG